MLLDPDVMVIRDGIILYAQPGALPEPALEQLIAKARELDMDEVRASVAERSGPSRPGVHEPSGFTGRQSARQTSAAMRSFPRTRT